MAPLVPGGVRRQRQDDGIKQDLNLAAAVEVSDVVVEELDTAEWRAEVALSAVRQEGENSLREEGGPVARKLAGGQKGAETRVGEQRRCFGIAEERVIAGTNIGLHEEVEGPVEIAECGTGRLAGAQFEPANLVGQPEIARRRGAVNAQSLVERGRVRPVARAIRAIEVVADGACGEMDRADAERAAGDFGAEIGLQAFVLLGRTTRSSVATEPVEHGENSTPSPGCRRPARW